MKYAPILIWIVQSAVIVAVTAVAIHFIDDKTLENVLAIVAGVIIVALGIFAFGFSREIGRNRW